MNEARPVLDRDAAAALIEPLTEIVIRAGTAILAINRSAMKVDGKTDGSPVTEADLAADRIIAEGLAQVAPTIPSLSEERVQPGMLPHKESFFLIDPLDGTKEFVAGRNEFTVNLALVTHGTPLLGIVSAPALGLIWRGIVGRGAERLTLGQGQTTDRTGAHPTLPAAGRAVDRGGQPAAWRCQDRSLHCGKAGRGTVRTRLGGQIRPGGRRRGRYLSAAVADLGMGRGRRPCGRRGRRRPDHGFKRRGAAIWHGAEGFHRSGIHRLG